MKSTQPFIVQVHNNDRNQLPYYHDYGLVLEKINQFILKETALTLKMYSDEEAQMEMWTVVEKDLTDGKVDLLAHVYEHVETGVVQFEQNGLKQAFVAKPSINNSIFYYEQFKIVLLRLPIFQAHSEYPRDYIFAENDETLLQFFDYVYERQREIMEGAVSIFTDTEDGVERTQETIRTQVSREHVLLEEELKTDIYRSIDEFFNQSSDFYKKYQIPYKRGILLYGPPGNGKTTMVKSIAGSIAAPVAYWQITEYTSSYSIQEVFSIVAKLAPMVLVIEDIDSMPESARSVFLNTLDGATSKEGIFLIGTTNYPERIDPALINRAGRFDRAYEIKTPTKPLRYRYLLTKKMDAFIDPADIEYMAEKTEQFSVAQLNELYTSAALQWHYEGKIDIDRLIDNLAESNKKSKTQQWESDEYETKMGFGF